MVPENVRLQKAEADLRAAQERAADAARLYAGAVAEAQREVFAARAEADRIAPVRPPRDAVMISYSTLCRWRTALQDMSGMPDRDALSESVDELVGEISDWIPEN